MTTDSQNSLLAEATLDSWKEIAVYLQRDVSTVMRWGKLEHLPVHRQHHLSRSSVYAYPSELEGWRANRRALAESTRYKWWRPVPAFASMITLGLALMMAGSGPHVGALVQAADGIVTRQVSLGADGVFDGAPSPDGKYFPQAERRTSSKTPVGPQPRPSRVTIPSAVPDHAPTCGPLPAIMSASPRVIIEAKAGTRRHHL